MNYTVNNVYKVYSGKAGACMCGCSGKYKVASAYRAYADKHRGYAHDDEDVSDRSVKIIFNKLMKAPGARIEEGIFHAEVNGRMLAAYFVEAE